MSGQGVTRFGRWAFLAVAASLLALSRVHLGLRHDARLYFGDALARLDPQGVGRDVIFAHDGQFGFSLYTPVLAWLVKGLGLNAAVALVSGLGLVVWLAALLLLVSRLLADLPVAWRRAATILVIVVAPYYGAHEVFAYGEAFATPRILVEAMALAALAAWLSDRRWLAGGLLVAALALHPIMALCGLAVLFVALCLEDRRWLLAGVAGGGLLVIAASLHLPVVDRLLRVMDPAWRAISEARSPTVFVSLWPAEAWGRIAVQAVTLGLAASLSRGPVRRLMTAVLIAGLLGVGFGWLADRLSLILPIQIQAWRTQALMAILAAAGLVVCLRALAGRGPTGLIAVCALGLGWTLIGWGAIALIGAAIALAAVLIGERATWSAPGLVRRGVFGLTVLLMAAWAVLRFSALQKGLLALPDGQGLGPGLIWNSGLPGWIAAVTALALAARPDRLKPRGALLGAVVLSALALLLWDNRSGFAVERESGADPELQALLSDRAGEVLWLVGDVEPWTLAGRASWASKFQGAGVVLSRPLALVLNDRIDRLISLGLVGPDWKSPFGAAPTTPKVPTLPQIRELCAARDAPAFVVAALPSGAQLDPALGARLWNAREPYELELAGQWFSTRTYGIIRCGGG
ncbi:hypothetical protein [Caulobacter henricii]|uniref:Glycosyltransferase RgtA/B/C/D-like domain-containing protein n=1 Tax=Caulobacter henricii TaxID=69395 RepID=A0A0N7JH92_9CAUL|nr:hypothetical protein [Caulobacter henricii]ALL12746.1 hypothetical protein AQ619_04895 [Caulobacter henricii]